MTFRFVAAALAACLALSAPVMAEDHPEGVHIHDAYARAMGGVGRSGAVFLTIHNHTTVDDRLVDAKSDVAERVELHTHKDDGNGVMQMIHVPEGFAVAAGEMHMLARGGDHVMLLGLTRDLKEGDTTMRASPRPARWSMAMTPIIWTATATATAMPMVTAADPFTR
ncbi:MAG: copper chaperone PCu(A)C [Cypionkella sp.]|nr:copper chaperone PCu(A)C [Cypionkella sp.]